ncbi:MAG TPA: ABC transporter ATP-binding protein [Chryseolinea sp.]|nr:ABC transporter ATP-binding protein [Chryseolinea sp.]HPM31639.1 ABC transporter ATP-binding protein [Chryseolinea sp.]
MVKLDKVTKHFGSKVVVDDFSLDINQGELFGLLGPNGAGKTTTINMIIGALAPESGSIKINGTGEPGQQDVKRLIGIVPQTLAVYETLTAEQNLEFFGRLYGLRGEELQDCIEHALKLVNLIERKDDRVSKYSGGMKRRLNIALALLHRPSLLILDEPTVGVDPQSRNAIFESIIKLKEEGCTIILTSHHIEEAQKLCDRVGIMDEGKLIAEDSVQNLISKHGGKSTLIVETSKGITKIETDQPVKEIIRLNEEDTILSLQMETPNLEKAFLNITGKHLRD